MNLQHLNTSNFDSTLQSNSSIIVIDFFATWCGPCKILTPILEQAADNCPEINFYKVDIDEDPSLAERYQIMTVPTLLFFKGDQMVDKSIGVISEDQIKSIIARHS